MGKLLNQTYTNPNSGESETENIYLVTGKTL